MSKFTLPKFNYGQTVKLIPCDKIIARVVDIHSFPEPMQNEYDVRYFENGDAKKCRVFEDELEAC
jgi:hypothetical protein